MSDKKEAEAPTEDTTFETKPIIPVMSLADFKVSREDVIDALVKNAADIHQIFLDKVQTFDE